MSTSSDLMLAAGTAAQSQGGPRKSITANDGAAALQGVAALLTAAAAGDVDQAQQAQQLLASLPAAPHPAMTTRSMEPAAANQTAASNQADLVAMLGGNTTYTPSPEFVDSLAAFLAQDATAKALTAAVAAGDEQMASLLDNPPYNRSGRCEALAGRNVTEEVRGYLNALPAGTLTGHVARVNAAFGSTFGKW
jgi:hypothetical protein